MHPHSAGICTSAVVLLSLPALLVIYLHMHRFEK